MKKFKFNQKFFSTAMLSLLASSALFAADGTSISGMSDLTLLYLLIAFGLLMLVVVFVISGIIKGLTTNKEIWNYLKSKNAAMFLLALLGFSSPSWAQDATASSSAPFVMADSLFYGILAIDLFLVVVVFYLFTVLKNVINTLRAPGEEVEEATVTESWAAALTDSVALEDEEEIMTDHAYDGIRELDNNLPPWWVMGFYATIVFAFGYLIYYHVLEGPSSKQEYMVAMAEAEAKKEVFMASMANSVDESNVTIVTDAAKLESGKSIYTANCAACHGQAGEGGVGPNFTDPYWIHGGGIADLFKTIKYGVPTKGMISWESQLSPSQMQEVASYILTFQGTNPPNQKEPQGELWEAPAEGDDASTEGEEATEEEQPEEVTREETDEMAMNQ